MKTARKYRCMLAAVCLLAIAVLMGSCSLRLPGVDPDNWMEAATEPTTTQPIQQPVEPVHQWQPGYVAASELQVEYYDGDGTPLGTLKRGTQVEYEIASGGKLQILLDGQIISVQEGAYIVADPTRIIPPHRLYVQTPVNLRTAEGKLLEAFAEKGAAVQVTGCDYQAEDGSVHMYRVSLGGQEGFVLPWYLTENEAEALANYDNGNYDTHAGRKNKYGGGAAADLDYFPREKGRIPGNEMPEECRALYIVSKNVSKVDSYLKIAEGSGINAFVVDIIDGGAIGYAGPVMEAYCPSAAAAAKNTVAQYQAAIKKIKDAGYYVIGRITTFHDAYFAKDHPEYAIADKKGKPLKLAGSYWPSAYNRTAWQYKVDLAVEAVELMGFQEIQFDYVRFPDRVSKYEKAGEIDYRNTYAETKAQAIQRFLMYATDILHERGVYVSADVFGECAYNYVTAYGQYWPAISNVVDVISGMPYPDHFSASGDWLPWEHPYDTVYTWGKNAMRRQKETETPAVVRTWIQAYNAIREPHNTYGPEEVAAEIKALRDSGCTGGYMTWNGAASLEKYKSLVPAFAPPEEA